MYRRTSAEAHRVRESCGNKKGNAPVINVTQQSPSKQTMNGFIAERLLEAADLLAIQGDNPFRVAAYRRAAESVKALDLDIETILDEGGVEALDRIPNVGKGIAASIAEMARTGRWAYLQRLRGSTEPEDLFCSIPGVGPKLAKRLHEDLHVETLEQLEAALAESKTPRGVGPRRAAMIKSGLDHLLARIRPAGGRSRDEPPVDLLLNVDREYVDKAARGLLPHIAPKRFNPEAEPWLPVLHTDRGKWHFTALFSNTARAHELGRVRDWVVIYFHDDHGGEAQRTIVTETRGPLRGRRVVRGRERECLPCYEDLGAEGCSSTSAESDKGGLRRGDQGRH
jgi:DNA polymerase (family 10)